MLATPRVSVFESEVREVRRSEVRAEVRSERSEREVRVTVREQSE